MTNKQCWEHTERTCPNELAVTVCDSNSCKWASSNRGNGAFFAATTVLIDSNCISINHIEGTRLGQSTIQVSLSGATRTVDINLIESLIVLTGISYAIAPCCILYFCYLY